MIRRALPLFCLMLFQVSLSTGCESRSTRCGKFYDRFTTCMKDLAKDGDRMADLLGASRDLFVAECKKDFDKFKKMVACADRTACGEFFHCALGRDLLVERKQADTEKKALEMGPK